LKVYLDMLSRTATHRLTDCLGWRWTWSWKGGWDECCSGLDSPDSSQSWASSRCLYCSLRRQTNVTFVRRTLASNVKVLVHPKILTLITHPHVVPHLHVHKSTTKHGSSSACKHSPTVRLRVICQNITTSMRHDALVNTCRRLIRKRRNCWTVIAVNGVVTGLERLEGE